MPTHGFISYSHVDEKALDRLHKHLAVVQREGLLSAWFDHAILPGSDLGQEIETKLRKSDVFLALVSPDYLASNYCYEKEFEYALALAQEGTIRIVPVILEPCDWLSSPLSKFMALPKDGKPVSEWTNANNAYLDIVTGMRRILAGAEPAQAIEQVGAPRAELGARRVRLKRDFDAIERAEFADRTFKVIRDYFQAAAVELSEASEDLRTRLEDMGTTAFTCTIVNRALQGQREAHITVHNHKGGRGMGMMGEISYSNSRHAEANTSNGGVRVEADEYNLYLSIDRFSSGREEGVKYTPERAAEWLWNKFVERAGVEYE